MKAWKTLSKEVILSRKPYLEVENHHVQLPDGRVIDHWTWINTPNFVLVAAITKDDRLVCLRQTKYAVNGITLATPGGYIEDGEAPLEAAKREVREEAGFSAEHWEDFGTYVVDGNRGNGHGHFFVAHGAYPIEKSASDDLEEQELLLLDRAAVEQALWNGKFKMIASQTLVAMVLLRWGKPGKK